MGSHSPRSPRETGHSRLKHLKRSKVRPLMHWMLLKLRVSRFSPVKPYQPFLVSLYSSNPRPLPHQRSPQSPLSLAILAIHANDRSMISPAPPVAATQSYFSYRTQTHLLPPSPNSPVLIARAPIFLASRAYSITAACAILAISEATMNVYGTVRYPFPRKSRSGWCKTASSSERSVCRV